MEFVQFRPKILLILTPQSRNFTTRLKSEYHSAFNHFSIPTLLQSFQKFNIFWRSKRSRQSMFQEVREVWKVQDMHMVDQLWAKTMKLLLKFGFSEKATKFEKNLRSTFDKSVVFCARNSVLVKESTKIFQNKCGQVVLYKL